MIARVSSPVAGTIVLPVSGIVIVDGQPATPAAAPSETLLPLGAGTHVVAVIPAR
jgi:hypothetical protein